MDRFRSLLTDPSSYLAYIPRAVLDIMVAPYLEFAPYHDWERVYSTRTNDLVLHATPRRDEAGHIIMPIEHARVTGLNRRQLRFLDHATVYDEEGLVTDVIPVAGRPSPPRSPLVLSDGSVVTFQRVFGAHHPIAITVTTKYATCCTHVMPSVGEEVTFVDARRFYTLEEGALYYYEDPLPAPAPEQDRDKAFAVGPEHGRRRDRNSTVTPDRERLRDEPGDAGTSSAQTRRDELRRAVGRSDYLPPPTLRQVCIVPYVNNRARDDNVEPYVIRLLMNTHEGECAVLVMQRRTGTEVTLHHTERVVLRYNGRGQCTRTTILAASPQYSWVSEARVAANGDIVLISAGNTNGGECGYLVHIYSPTGQHKQTCPPPPRIPYSLSAAPDGSIHFAAYDHAHHLYTVHSLTN